MSRYVSPYTASTRFLRGNLHAHTCCGRWMDIGESGRFYKRLGYDFLAVTDHNLTWSDWQVRNWRECTGLVIIPGEENGATNHIIELGVHAVTPTPQPDYASRAASLREAGGFVFACHPQEYAHGDDNVRAGISSIHAIEIYNGLRELRGSDEPRNIVLWDEMLTKGHRVWGVATDDFHCSYTSPAHGWVNVQFDETATEITWQAIVEKLKQGAFYASTGPSFNRIDFDGAELRVEADQYTKRITIVGAGGQTLHEQAGTQLNWRAPGGLAYFRIEAVRGIKRAWSQPFFPTGA